MLGAQFFVLGSGNALIWEKVIRIRTVTTSSAFSERRFRASGEHGECYELARQRRVKRSKDGGRNERVASQRSGAALAGVTDIDR